jgi:hypothetical protein
MNPGDEHLRRLESQWLAGDHSEEVAAALAREIVTRNLTDPHWSARSAELVLEHSQLIQVMGLESELRRRWESLVYRDITSPARLWAAWNNARSYVTRTRIHPDSPIYRWALTRQMVLSWGRINGNEWASPDRKSVRVQVSWGQNLSALFLATGGLGTSLFYPAQVVVDHPTWVEEESVFAANPDRRLFRSEWLLSTAAQTVDGIAVTVHYDEESYYSDLYNLLDLLR